MIVVVLVCKTMANRDPHIYNHPSYCNGEQRFDGPNPSGLAIPHAVAKHQLCHIPHCSDPDIEGAETPCFWLDESRK